MANSTTDTYLESLNPDPIRQFHAWYAQAEEAGTLQPQAMALATADAEGRPSVRIVLIKNFSKRGFVFVTNYGSRKGMEIEVNPRAAATFHWARQERQVRVEGRIEKVTPEESDRLFAARPRENQLSSAASLQSRPTTFQELDNAYLALQQRFEGREIPRPDSWGGYLLVPDSIEFWQHRFARMNDRVLYSRAGTGWERVRLAP